MINKSICRGLLVCMRTTIGSGAKRLFVSYANNYSIALRANSGLSAIDYCFTPHPQEGSLSERLHSASTACEAVCSNVLRMLSDGTIKRKSQTYT